MRFANEANDLAVKFKRLEVNAALGADMLVMERVYPVDFRAYEVEMREIWFDAFREELLALHAAGFVHHHIQRPPTSPASASTTSCSPPRACA